METPSQALIKCAGCGDLRAPHSKMRLQCDPCAKAKQVEYQRTYRSKVKATAPTVVCRGCGKQFDASVKGRKWRCPDCLAAYQREYQQQRRDKVSEYMRAYRKRQGDAYRAKMRQRRAAAIEADETSVRQAEAARARRINAALRAQVFAAYGGHICACCGETDAMFLTIDHVANDGAEMRRNGTHGRGGTAFYQWLRKSGFPPGFQVLCMNCNIGKHRNGGVCPHQSRKV